MTTRKMNLVIKEIRNILGSNADVKMIEVVKGNDLILHGITIKFEDSPNALPAMYLENYNEKLTSREIAKQIIVDNAKQAEIVKHTNIDAEDIITFNDHIKSHIIYNLINKKANEKLLEKVPHRDFLDLAIIYKIQIDDEVSAKVTNELLNVWNVNEETLYELAKENTPRIFPAKVRPMIEIITEMIGMSIEEFTEMSDNTENKQVVVTNEHTYHGAITILYPNVIEELHAKYGNLVILPSSVHEVIVMPDEGLLTEEALTEMVTDINNQIVVSEEVLSNHPYFYDGEWK